MLRQYRVLTSCLSELKASNLPAIDKLKLEIQIIRIKRVLLDQEVAHRVLGNANSERAFDDLHDQVRSVCSSGLSDRGTEELFSHLEALRIGLEYGTTTDARERFRQRKGLGGRVLGAFVKATS